MITPNTERAISVDDLTGGHPELNWLLEDLVARVVGARHAVVLSADGLLLARSPELS